MLQPVFVIIFIQELYQIPTVLQPSSETFPDLMISSLVYIMFGFSGPLVLHETLSISITITHTIKYVK